MHSLSLLRRASALALVAPLVFGCAAGPDFVPPAGPKASAYLAQGTPLTTVGIDRTGGAAQIFAAGMDVPAAWWDLYHAESLRALVRRAIEGNPDLAAAKAALRQANENALASQGGLWPALDGGAGAARQKNVNTFKPYTLYNTTVSVSFAPDVFGGTRREIEQMEALTEMQGYETDAAYLTLTSNVVTTAIKAAALRDEIVATNEIIKTQKDQLALIEQQFKLGAVAKAAVLAQIASLATVETTLPPLEKSLAIQRHQLSALLGQMPYEDLAETFSLASLHLPEVLPISVPSALVRARPDIRAAEANLHAASAAVGVATANMLPKFSLTGSYGVGANTLDNMFSPGTALWSLAGGLTQPLFHGGELTHKRKASEAAYDQAAAQYKSVVLGAFQNVADCLKALESDAKALAAQDAAEKASLDSLTLTRAQFKSGAVSYLALLNAEQAYQQSHLGVVDALATRYADTAALFVALGGGLTRDSGENASFASTDLSQK